MIKKEKEHMYCDICDAEMPIGMPNGVIIEEGSKIHGIGNSLFSGDYCSKKCFLVDFNKEADRLGLV